jgi:RNA polymerase-binding transcription factor
MLFYDRRDDAHESPRAELYRLLARQKAELSARKQLLRDDITPGPGEGRDALESSADNFARDVGAAILEVTARTVQGIEDALRRLKTGAYGTCLDCGEKIPALRLQALPFAERCRDCQLQCDPVPVPRSTPLLA